MTEFEFTNEDLKFNRQGNFSPRQKEWLEKQATGFQMYSRIGTLFNFAIVPILVCVIGSVLLRNESYRKSLDFASPVGLVALGFGIFLIFGSVIVGAFVSRKRSKDFFQPELLVAEGKATLHTYPVKYGKGYYIMLDDTRVNLDWEGKFEEGKRYRVCYYIRPDGLLLLMSYEKLS